MKKQIILIIVSFSVIAVLASFFGRSNPKIRSVDKSLWVRHWEQLDLAHIKKVYQPYTVAEMIDKWDDKLIAKYDGTERFKQAIGKAGEVYPKDKYLARMLELDRPV